MIKTFTCKICNKEFQKETKSYAYYCPECRKEKDRKAALDYACRTGRIKKPGVGSGGNQQNKNNSQWSNYKAEYSYRHYIKEMKECHFCKATTNLCRHHIDFNRKNNTESNLIVVCRSCHSKLHSLHKNFISRNKTTLNGGTTQDNPVPNSNTVGVTTIPDEYKGVDSSESKDVATEK